MIDLLSNILCLVFQYFNYFKSKVYSLRLIHFTELPPAKAGGLAQQSQMTKVISPLLQTRNTSKEERDAVVPYLLN
jgi:hypothetical protein